MSNIINEDSKLESSVIIDTKLTNDKSDIKIITDEKSTERIQPTELCTDLNGIKYHPEIRNERVFKFNTEKYDFRGAIQRIIEKSSNQKVDNLEELHLAGGEAGLAVIDKNLFKTKGDTFKCSKQQIRWNLDRGRLKPSLIEKYAEFDEIYDRFIREVVAPDAMGGGHVLYQRAPTLRVYFPSEIASVFLHCDKEYHHQPSEINFWLPLTCVLDNNTLWLESQPNKNDFHPVRIQYGEYLRFYGNLCRHFTKPNDTSQTRISLDFRAVSSLSGTHNPDFDRGVNRGSKAKYEKCFDVGGYYSEVTVENSLN